MNKIVEVSQVPRCPSCDRSHSQRVADCPLCDATWKQGALGNLGVWDGLALRQENEEEAEGYAAFVACGCGHVGPSAATCAEAITAWNLNTGLIRERIDKRAPIDANNVRNELIAVGFLPQQEAA